MMSNSEMQSERQIFIGAMINIQIEGITKITKSGSIHLWLDFHLEDDIIEIGNKWKIMR